MKIIVGDTIGIVVGFNPNIGIICAGPNHHFQVERVRAFKDDDFELAMIMSAFSEHQETQNTVRSVNIKDEHLKKDALTNTASVDVLTLLRYYPEVEKYLRFYTKNREAINHTRH